MNAERLLAHYERIADAPDAIARLRRFILDLAVRGKLVPQDPNDEPASELLKRIAEEKARLVKAGEISKAEAAEGHGCNGLPFAIPRLGWVAWRQSGDCAPATDATDSDSFIKRRSAWMRSSMSIRAIQDGQLVRYRENGCRSVTGALKSESASWRHVMGRRCRNRSTAQL